MSPYLGEARSGSAIESHLERNFGVSGVTMASEYLADQGLVGKASIAVRLTKKSNADVLEFVFFSIGSPPEKFMPSKGFNV